MNTKFGFSPAIALGPVNGMSQERAIKTHVHAEIIRMLFDDECMSALEPQMVRLAILGVSEALWISMGA